MASRFITAAFAIGVVALAVTFVMPALLAAPHEATDKTVRLETGESKNINQNLDTALIDTNNSANTATFEIADLSDGFTANRTVGVGDSETVDMPDGNVTITVDSLPGSNMATLTVSHPSTYGMSDDGEAISENMGIFLVALSLILVFGIIIIGVNL